MKYSLFSFLLCCFSVCFVSVKAQSFSLGERVPLIGAEVFIEPGQSKGYIDSMFLLLRQQHMKLTRIRLFENYMRLPDGQWDFTLFDNAYRAAEKYGINIWGNFFPATGFEDVGGFKFPRTQSHLDSVADYIKNCVLHFKQFSSHAGWALLNEIGSAKIPATPLSQERYRDWLKENAWQPAPGSYRGFGFDEQRFLLDHNTWYLQWLAAQVKQYDPAAHLHVNNHAIFQLVGEYDFPAWRNTLSSFGGSAHASWHFGYFTRSRYPYAVATNSAILNSGAGNKPWLMTELQGGNNTYSGYDAMCPSGEEITQWLWTVIGGGGKGGIFWSLNPRAGGFEAGEWAMLNYQNQPTDRLLAAGRVAHTLEKHADLFATAKPAKPVVHLLYTRPSLWLEEKMQIPGAPATYEGRQPGGVMKSVLGYYETLLELGVPTAISEWNEFDFSQDDYSGTVLILAQQISLPHHAATQLENFVSKGGILLVDGLTGYYDEHAIATAQTGFTLRKLLGGMVREFRMEGQRVPLKIYQPSVTLPGHAWRGYLQSSGGTVIAGNGHDVFALEHKMGKGTAIWFPTMVGLGSRMHGNSQLAAWLQDLLKAGKIAMPVSFKTHQPGILMQTLDVPGGWITIVINKSGSKASPVLQLPGVVVAQVLVGSPTASVQANRLTLNPEETVVIYWERK